MNCTEFFQKKSEKHAALQVVNMKSNTGWQPIYLRIFENTQLCIFQLHFQGSVNTEGGNTRNAVPAKTTVWCSEVTSAS